LATWHFFAVLLLECLKSLPAVGRCGLLLSESQEQGVRRLAGILLQREKDNPGKDSEGMNPELAKRDNGEERRYQGSLFR
jgi:hypothetical protein